MLSSEPITFPEIDIQRYEHFSFDLWLTLIRSNPSFKPAMVREAISHFDLSDDFETVLLCFRKHDVLCNKISEISGQHVSAKQILLMILNELRPGLEDMEPSTLDAFEQKTQQLFLEHPPLLKFNDTPELFEQISSKGKTISLISNTGFISGQTIRQVPALSDLMPHFEFTLFSDETGYSKPNPRMFELSFDKLQNKTQTEKKQVLHIGDNPLADYEGAKAFGYEALLI